MKPGLAVTDNDRHALSVELHNLNRREAVFLSSVIALFADPRNSEARVLCNEGNLTVSQQADGVGAAGPTKGGN